MAVHAQPHAQEWRIIDTDGYLIQTYRNGVEAQAAVAHWRRAFPYCKAVRA